MKIRSFVAGKRHASAAGVVVLAASTLVVAVLLPDRAKPPAVVMADGFPSETPGVLPTILPSLFETPSPSPTAPTPSPSPEPSLPFETGQEANGYSELWPGSAISADGRFVVFSSYASNLVPEDGPSKPDPVEGPTYGRDVFVRDVNAATTSMISLSSSGKPGNGESGWGGAVISADGRFVAFTSRASNLVRGDTNGVQDVFVRDRATRTTKRVSVDSSGGQASGESGVPAISADGRYIMFGSEASDLVKGDTNRFDDVFLHDIYTGDSTRVSVSSSGGQGNSWSGLATMSADGRTVAFLSEATNLVPGARPGSGDLFAYMDLLVRDISSGTTDRIAWVMYRSSPPFISITPDGRFIAFSSAADDHVSGDTNDVGDVFVYDRESGTVERVSVSSSGEQADRASWDPVLSSDGRYVAFGSNATNLIENDRQTCESADDGGWCGGDVFLRDLRTGLTTLISTSSSGRQGNDDSGWPSISTNGRFVVFVSRANNLVDPDTNRCHVFEPGEPCFDIFLRDTVDGSTIRLSDS